MAQDQDYKNSNFGASVERSPKTRVDAPIVLTEYHFLGVYHSALGAAWSCLHCIGPCHSSALPATCSWVTAYDDSETASITQRPALSTRQITLQSGDDNIVMDQYSV